jgi:hypothetical protein
MATIDVLGNQIPLIFLTGRDALIPMDQPALTEAAMAMAAAINSVAWEPAHPDYAAAFRGVKGIVFFEGVVTVNGFDMDRPCMDEDDAVFYWESSEFTRNPDPRAQAQTFFHDCWHVVQFKRLGGFARTETERVDREIDAIDHQIEVAALLGCDPSVMTFLADFRDGQGNIQARLAEGVKMHHNKAVGFA